jgi:hypothetical protein
MSTDANHVTLSGTVGNAPDHRGPVSTIMVRTGYEWHMCKYAGAGREKLRIGSRVVISGVLRMGPPVHVEAEGVVLLHRAPQPPDDLAAARQMAAGLDMVLGAVLPGTR